MSPPARLSSPRDFQRVIEHGKRTTTPTLSVSVVPTDDEARVGVSASKRIGSAIHRNRAKRLLREAAAACGISGVDAVLVARPGIAGKSCQHVKDDLSKALQRLGVTC